MDSFQDNPALFTVPTGLNQNPFNRGGVKITKKPRKFRNNRITTLKDKKNRSMVRFLEPSTIIVESEDGIEAPHEESSRIIKKKRKNKRMKILKMHSKIDEMRNSRNSRLDFYESSLRKYHHEVSLESKDSINQFNSSNSDYWMNKTSSKMSQDSCKKSRRTLSKGQIIKRKLSANKEFSVTHKKALKSKCKSLHAGNTVNLSLNSLNSGATNQFKLFGDKELNNAIKDLIENKLKSKQELGKIKGKEITN